MIDSIELVWDDVLTLALEKNPEMLNGGFVVFEEAGLKMWVPENFIPAELSDEEKGMGLVAVYGTENGCFTIVKSALTIDETTAYQAEVEASGATDILTLLINGDYALSYTIEPGDTTVVACFVPDGVVEFSFQPMSDNDFSTLAATMMASIQAI